MISTLNTIFKIGDNFGLRIHSIDSLKFKIIWKMYHANITLILIEDLTCQDESVSFRKLDLLFDTLVFMYGLEDLINISNVEKFKKDIQVNSLVFSFFKLKDFVYSIFHFKRLYFRLLIQS